MRFHFVSHPITKDGNKDSISIEFRDALYPKASRSGVTINWIRGAKDDWASPQCNLIGEPSEVIAMSRILRALDSFCESAKIDMNDPDALLVQIERASGEHVVLNGHDYIRVSKLGGDDISWKAVGVDGQAIITVKSKEEDDAKKTAGRKIMDMTDEDPAMNDKLMAWIKAGKPVKRVDKNSDIKVHPLDAYCKRGHQRAAAEKKEKDTKPTMTIPAKK